MDKYKTHMSKRQDSQQGDYHWIQLVLEASMRSVSVPLSNSSGDGG